jgi:hypothetical protein
MTSVLLERTASYYLALEARGPTVHSLERAVQAEELENAVEELETSVEEVETVVEAVAGSVWPPQVLEEIQHCHRPQHYDALGRELDLGWRSPCKENNYKFCEQTFF